MQHWYVHWTLPTISVTYSCLGTESRSSEKPDQDQLSFANIWRSVRPDTNILFQPTIRGALEAAKNISNDNGSMQALITGSQHVVGGALSLLQNHQKP
jgi:hypothetical protein